MKIEKETAEENGITLKNRFGQYFCKHKNTQWFVHEGGSFQNIRGERRYLSCTDCGKHINDYFAEYEGNGFK